MTKKRDKFMDYQLLCNCLNLFFGKAFIILKDLKKFTLPIRNCHIRETNVAHKLGFGIYVKQYYIYMFLTYMYVCIYAFIRIITPYRM